MKICFKENFETNIFEEEQTKFTLKVSSALNNKRLDRSKNSSINTNRNIQNKSNNNINDNNNNSSIKNTANNESITNLVINNIEKINDNDSIIRLDGNYFAVDDLYVSSTSFDKEFEDENEDDYSKSKILKLNLNKNKILYQNPKIIKKYFSVNFKKNEKDEPGRKNVLKSSVSFM